VHTSADCLILPKFGLRHGMPIWEIDLDHGRPIAGGTRSAAR
jgi:hypothetical protein